MAILLEFNPSERFDYTKGKLFPAKIVGVLRPARLEAIIHPKKRPAAAVAPQGPRRFERSIECACISACTLPPSQSANGGVQSLWVDVMRVETII